MKKWLNKILAIISIISLTGCTLVRPDTAGEEKEVSDEEVKQVVSKVIDENWDQIKEYVGDMPVTMRSADGRVDADRIVEETLAEEHGREYLSFCYSVATGADTDTILHQAKQLLPEDTYADLLVRVDDNRRSIYESYGARLFTITKENQEDFYHDLQKLVVSSTVLLVSSIVYTAMPHIFFWGKISALAAVSVSAGAIAGTIMSVYAWYETDQSYDKAFKDWLTMITEAPYAAYLMTTSVISLGQSMSLNPICCSVILGVFTLFNALNIVRDMIEVYGDGD